MGHETKKYKMLIGGEFVNAASGKTREICDPGNGKVVAIVPESSKADIDAAVSQARAAFDHGPWRQTSALDRGKLLFKIADGIRARAAKLAELEVLSCGKP
jgi:betaine-aldehyde dehydrogenase